MRLFVGHFEYDIQKWTKGGGINMKVFYTRKKTVIGIGIGLIVIVLLIAGGIILLHSRAVPKDEGLKVQSTVVTPKATEFIQQKTPALTQYEMTVDFNAEKKIVFCSQKTLFKNNEKIPLREVFLHLYPNAYKYKDKVPFSEIELQEAYPNGFSSGSLTLKNVMVQNKKAIFFVEGKSEDLLRIPLVQELQPGQVIQLNMTYEVKLPNSLGRFGYGLYTYNVANWYPIVSVYDQTGWNNDPYYAIGDPFYSDVADYKVSITAPKDQIIATTGTITRKINEGDHIKWEIDAKNVRDFAWVSSNQFKILSRRVNGVEINSYCFSDAVAEKALDYGMEAIRIFGNTFGVYPYSQFSVVEADFFIGGMEYPNMVMIDKSMYNKEAIKWLEFVIAHEAGHQWWYGVVGNNEVDEAWLDEALTEYSTILYYGERYNQQREETMFQDMVVNQSYNRLKLSENSPHPVEIIDQPVYKFKDLWQYDSLVYGKGAMMFRDLNKQMGDRNFMTFLRTYYQKYQYANVTKKDLIATCNAVTGKKWEPFFDQWLYGK